MNIRVLFISQTRRTDTPYMDPSVRYRCYNFAEDIRVCGGTADVISGARFEPAMVSNYDYFVFHRPHPQGNKLARTLEAIAAQGKQCHADYDDLIFHPAHALESSIYLNGNATEQATLDIFRTNHAAFQQFSRFTVSTEPLAERVRDLAPDAAVEVVPNGLSRTLLGSYKVAAWNEGRRQHRGRIRILSYLSGTASHNPDFAYVAPVLSELLAKREDCRLLIAGPLEFDSALFSDRQIIRLPAMSYRQFFDVPRRAHVNLAPLKPNNAFNNCKSALKFFESGIWGVPTIASPIDDFRRFTASAGLSLPRDRDGWRADLERLLDDNHYERATEGLFEFCMDHCLSEASAGILWRFLGQSAETCSRRLSVA